MPLYAPTAANLSFCAARLTQGQLVAFPTETVYGLGADATNAQAVARIYEQKRRPQFNPLICHVRDKEDAQQYGLFNTQALRLAETFWPGALSLVVPRRANSKICSLACAGLDTIALRVPAHNIAQDLLHAAQCPLAAPSANPSARLSPTSARHVAAMFEHIDVIDGGACDYGVESSIIGCFDDGLFWLRAGSIARADIETVIGARLSDMPQAAEKLAKRAPGRLARHYAPRARLKLNVIQPKAEAALLAFGDVPHGFSGIVKNLSPLRDVREAAANLFSYLHDLDAALAAYDNPYIAVMPIPHHGVGEAINDRLRRAAAG